MPPSAPSLHPLHERRAIAWAFLAVLLASRSLGAQVEEGSAAATWSRPSCAVQLQGGRRVDDRGDRNYYAALTLTSPWGGCWSSAADAAAVPTPARPRETSSPDEPEEPPESDATPPRPDLEPEQWEDLELPPEELEDLSPEDWKELTRQDDPSGARRTRHELTDLASARLAKTAPRRRRPRAGAVAYAVSPRLARAVADAALRAAGYHALGVDLSAAASRARWSAALPDVRLRAARALDETARVDYAGDLVGDTRLTGRADVRLEAALTWRLSEVVFSGREPSLARIQLTFLRQRQEVVRSALRALFLWQRTRNRVGDPTLLPEERAEALLENIEAEVELAVLTGGWFSAERVLGPVPRGDDGARSDDEPSDDEPSDGPSAPAAGPNGPGHRAAPGVNEPRDAFRDAKQVDGPQEAR